MILAVTSTDLAALQMFGVLFCVFCGVFFLVLAVSDIMRRRADIRKRATTDWTAPSGSAGSNLNDGSRKAASLLLSRVERAKERKSERYKLRQDLERAGYFNESAVWWYQSARLFLFFGAAALTPLVLAYAAPGLTPDKTLIITGIVAFIGFLLPSRYVAYRQGTLVKECREGFPDVMDLLVICTESGLSPRAAIDRIAREITSTYSYLGANLYLVSLELRAGNTLHEALAGLGRRVQLDEIVSFAALLQQTEQLGTSVSDALRVYSDEMRTKRLARAEERAHALPVKLVIPLGIFVFPVMLVVILMPVIIRIKTALF